MTFATTVAFYCLRASLVAGVGFLPLHAMATVPGFTGSTFGLLCSFQALLGLLSMQAGLVHRLQEWSSPLATNAILSGIMGLSSLCAAGMRPEYGGLNWVLLFLYCVCFGPSISGHYAVGPAALAMWATHDMRGLVISLGAMANAATHIIMPFAFSVLYDNYSGAFMFAANAGLAFFSGALFYLMHLANGGLADGGLDLSREKHSADGETDAPPFPWYTKATRVLFGCLDDNDAVFLQQGLKPDHHDKQFEFSISSMENSMSRDSSPDFNRDARPSNGSGTELSVPQPLPRPSDDTRRSAAGRALEEARLHRASIRALV